MSATIPNVENVAAWLGAKLFITTWRPVPLARRLLVRCSEPSNANRMFLTAAAALQRALMAEHLVHVPPIGRLSLCAQGAVSPERLHHTGISCSIQIQAT